MSKAIREAIHHPPIITVGELIDELCRLPDTAIDPIPLPCSRTGTCVLPPSKAVKGRGRDRSQYLSGKPVGRAIGQRRLTCAEKDPSSALARQWQRCP